MLFLRYFDKLRIGAEMMRVFSRIEVGNVESKGTGAASYLPSLGLPAWPGWFVCPSSVAVLPQRVEKREGLRFEEKSPLRFPVRRAEVDIYQGGIGT